MKRLTLDLYKEDNQIKLDIYHTIQDKSEGYRASARNADALIQGIDKQLAEILYNAPDIDQAEALKVVQSNDWYYIHQSKLQSYNTTISSLTEARELLEEQIRIKDAQREELHIAFETKQKFYRETIKDLNDKIDSLEKQIKDDTN